MSASGKVRNAEREKHIQEKFQHIISELLQRDENKFCADCDAKGPRWCSWNLGVFLCIRCAGMHRNLGVHISRVKSVNLDSWTPEQLAHVMAIGNSKARAIYEANIPDHFRRPQSDSALEQFIRSKYDQKKYIAREWIPEKVTVPQGLLDIMNGTDLRRDKKRPSTGRVGKLSIAPGAHSGDRRHSVSTSSDTSEPATSPRVTEFDKSAFSAEASASSHATASVKPGANAATGLQAQKQQPAVPAPGSAAQDLFGDLLGFEAERSHSAPPVDQFDPFGPMQSAAPAAAANSSVAPATSNPPPALTAVQPALTPSAGNMGGGSLLDDLVGIDLHSAPAVSPVATASTNQSILALYAQAPPSGAMPPSGVPPAAMVSGFGMHISQSTSALSGFSGMGYGVVPQVQPQLPQTFSQQQQQQQHARFVAPSPSAWSTSAQSGRGLNAALTAQMAQLQLGDPRSTVPTPATATTAQPTGSLF